MATDPSTQSGESFPLGSTVCPEGANFSAYSKSSTRMELLFFDRADDSKPSAVIPLDPIRNRSYHYWHVFVPGIEPGQIYGYRAFGPFEPDRGMRFDPDKILMDPYGRAMAVPEHYSRVSASIPGDNCATAMKSVVVDPTLYDWQGDTLLKRPFAQTLQGQ